MEKRRKRSSAETTVQHIERYNKKGISRKELQDTIDGFLFISPNVLFFLAFTLIPTIISLMWAFTDKVALMPARFIGLHNFINLIFDTTHPERIFNHTTWRYMGNTVYYMAGIPLGMGVSLGLALLVNTRIRGVVVYRTIFYLPVVALVVATAVIWKGLWSGNGMINQMLLRLECMNPPDWLRTEGTAKLSIILWGTWSGAGYNMLLYLAALQGIPKTYYEAANIDGAGWWQKFKNITFPLLGPTHFFILVMALIWNFQIFTPIWTMYGENAPEYTRTLVYLIYIKAFRGQFELGYASAAAWFLFVLIFIITLVQLKVVQKSVHYEH